MASSRLAVIPHIPWASLLTGTGACCQIVGGTACRWRRHDLSCRAVGSGRRGMRRVVGVDEDELVLARVDLDKIQCGALEQILAGIGDEHVDSLGDEMRVVLTLLVEAHAV